MRLSQPSEFHLQTLIDSTPSLEKVHFQEVLTPARQCLAIRTLSPLLNACSQSPPPLSHPSGVPLGRQMAFALCGPRPSLQEGRVVSESAGSALKHLVQITKMKTSSNCSQPQQAAPCAATPRLLLVRSAFQVSDGRGMSKEHGMILLQRETSTQGGLMTP